VEELELLKSEARSYKKSAFATTTQKTYRCQLKCFLNFCLDHKCKALPASQDTLLCYIAFLARKMVPSSIACYLNVVRILHVEAGFSNPLEGNYELAMVKRGIRREKGVPPNQKEPISLLILARIHATLDLASPADLAFWACCLVGFFGFLRKSSLLPASPTVRVDKMLTRDDVIDFSFDSFTLLVRFSKVIQFGHKVLSIPYCRTATPVLCPIRAVLAHFGASPLAGGRPLFNFLSRGVENFFSPSMFVVRLRQALKLTGLNAAQFSAHSLRRGGASYAFEIGLSPLQIKQRGDWASSAYEKYVFISAAAGSNIASALAKGVPLL
jgi:hypothetical protein